MSLKTASDLANPPIVVRSAPRSQYRFALRASTFRGSSATAPGDVGERDPAEDGEGARQAAAAATSTTPGLSPAATLVAALRIASVLR